MARQVIVGSTHLVRDPVQHEEPMLKVVRGTHEPYSFSKNEITTGDVVEFTDAEFEALVADYAAIKKVEAGPAKTVAPAASSAPAAPAAKPAASAPAPAAPPAKS